MSIPPQLPKIWRRLALLADACDWRIVRQGNNHFAWMPPRSKRIVVTPCSPSDTRSFRNARARLEAAGLPVRQQGRQSKRKAAAR